jgi:hypothetical protein
VVLKNIELLKQTCRLLLQGAKINNIFTDILLKVNCVIFMKVSFLPGVAQFPFSLGVCDESSVGNYFCCGKCSDSKSFYL